MMTKMFTIGLAVIVAVVASGGGLAKSRDRHRGDNDLARSALQHGEVLPITRILPLVAQHMPGDVVEVRLDSRQGGRLYYKIKVLTPSGHLRELILDARTGAYVATED